MEEEEWVSNMYKRLMKTKSKEDRKELLRGISEDQNRRLTAFIKKKNKIEVTKKIKVKAENRHGNKPNTLTRNYRVLVDYTNINFDLSLTNYVGRVLRINKIKDTHRLSKALHLYMNILCGIVFKKFAYENKDKQNNKTLLIFLKQLFPFEFKNYESKYIERWAPHLNPTHSKKNEDTNKKNEINRNIKASMSGDIKEALKGIVKEKKEDIKERYDIKDKCQLENKCKIKEKEEREQTETGGNFFKSNTNDMLKSANDVECNGKNMPNEHIVNRNEMGMKDGHIKNSSCAGLVKIEPCEEYEKNQIKVEGNENENENENDIRYRNGKILQNKLIYFIHKELENECTSTDEKRKIKEITSVLFDEKRFDCRNRLRCTVAKYLNSKEYKEFCNLRDKLFKYKKSTFTRWIQTYTKIRHLDLYIVNFFIFLFIDRLNVIIETYMRLNYSKDVDSCEKFVKGYRKICTISEILDDFCKYDNNFTRLKDSSGKSINSNVPDFLNMEVNMKTEDIENVPSIESDILKNGETLTNKLLCSYFNKKYQGIVKENETTFFLSLQLIYNLDVYYFQVRNKITFEKLIDINMSTYINESNIYELMSFEKGKDEDPWTKFVHFVASQNSNMKLQKFDYFTVFLVSRFKFYLEEFKENANIDTIYKTIKEEFDEVENFVTCKTDNPDFEHSYLVPLYASIKREVQKAQEYIKFYGNLTSFVNFIEKFIKPWDGPCIIKKEKVEENSTTKGEQDTRYFDLPFFLSPINVKVEKEKHRT